MPLLASQPPVSIFLSAMQAKTARNAFFAIFARLGRRSEGKNSDGRQAEVLDAWLPLVVPCPAWHGMPGTGFHARFQMAQRAYLF